MIARLQAAGDDIDMVMALTKPERQSPERLTLRPPFEVVSTSETGHEVRDGDGQVFAWAPDRGRGLVLAGLLETAARG